MQLVGFLKILKERFILSDTLYITRQTFQALDLWSYLFSLLIGEGFKCGELGT